MNETEVKLVYQGRVLEGTDLLPGGSAEMPFQSQMPGSMVQSSQVFPPDMASFNSIPPAPMSPMSSTITMPQTGASPQDMSMPTATVMQHGNKVEIPPFVNPPGNQFMDLPVYCGSIDGRVGVYGGGSNNKAQLRQPPLYQFEPPAPMGWPLSVGPYRPKYPGPFTQQYGVYDGAQAEIQKKKTGD
jgi:hypothetical protein